MIPFTIPMLKSKKIEKLESLLMPNIEALRHKEKIQLLFFQKSMFCSVALRNKESLLNSTIRTILI